MSPSATHGGNDTGHAAAVQLLEDGDYDGALTALGDAADHDTSGELDALAGLAHFRAERYNDAADRYAAALSAKPGQSDWTQMLAACRANVTAEVDVQVPPLSYFERDALLSEPPDPLLPTPPKAGFDLSVWRRLRYVAGHAVGSVGGVVFGWLTQTFGKNYRGDVWTTWYRKRMYRGMLTLAYMREKLNTDNLKSTYPAGAKTGFLPDDHIVN